MLKMLSRVLLTGLSVVAVPAFAQHGGGRGGGNGNGNGGGNGGGNPGAAHYAPPPARGPAPFRAVPVQMQAPMRAQAPAPVRMQPQPMREPMHMYAPVPPPARPPSVTVQAPPGMRPHVERSTQWIGHDSGPRDERFRVERPWAEGRFRGGFGRNHVYSIGGWEPERRRFWSGGAYFNVAQWEYDYIDDWSWDTDNVVIYNDPDHEGWYLAYNTRLGTYIHVQYGGAYND